MRSDRSTRDVSPIIASADDPTGPVADPARFALWCAVAVMLWGIAAAWVYYLQDLTLSHYDAKAHLVVARRVIDSITPGWRQIGAVWLPLPHLLNLLPVQVDLLYRTGASGIAISILSMGLATYACAEMVLRATGSRAGAVLCSTLLAFNPNILYLQSTPMTEPLLIGLLMLSAMTLYGWAREGSTRWRRAAGWSLAAACLTRYEAWPFTAAVLTIAPLARRQAGGPARVVLRDVAMIAAYPAAAAALFVINSKLSIGKWFVTGGFYVPDPTLQGRLFGVTGAIGWGTRQLGSTMLLVAAVAGAAAVVARVLRDRRLASLLVPLTLVAVTALPWYAFFQGHPFRIRYMVPAVAAAIAAAGLGIGLLPRRVQLPAASIVLLGVLASVRPFDPRAAMVLEAQWDRPNSRGRQHVTVCLRGETPRPTVMASMGSLAHYMHELSHAGFGIRDFLHEGNGDIWAAALNGPARYVDWVLIEERARGGDMLYRRAAADPRFLAGFDRVCAGGGVALYHNRDAGGRAGRAPSGGPDVRSESGKPPGK
jgi:hypothetical protein